MRNFGMLGIVIGLMVVLACSSSQEPLPPQPPAPAAPAAPVPTVAVVVVPTQAPALPAPAPQAPTPVPELIALYPVTVENCGISFTYDEAPTRAIAMNQHVTEVMLALGLEDNMIGTAYIDDFILAELGGWREGHGY